MIGCVFPVFPDFASSSIVHSSLKVIVFYILSCMYPLMYVLHVRSSYVRLLILHGLFVAQGHYLLHFVGYLYKRHVYLNF
jgi:hypothetical protein